MAVLGDLEHRVMGALWRTSQARSVREVHEELSGEDGEKQLAYTTVMTVLDRLAKKDLVMRERDGRAWIYRPAVTQARLIADEMYALLVDVDPSERPRILDELRGLIDGDPAMEGLRRSG
ncbi:BlaI/MecI/CopY family transcriptional regulator [Parenemella sanctibonifatiensis]|uniref:CopY family transcriptional regulator n=1 Tax=Parenemella sanctibonifatiensis TaxID=2016505 RepID=A0A255EJ48_9ACTN|nr:BlaI/MecI/CopY family transcriptional regulator [Parenemella sanctibonifatiensis]OYN89452.1 CopY family transcriptional regulator [Parenemella sanctibonifatiensis]